MLWNLNYKNIVLTFSGIIEIYQKYKGKQNLNYLLSDYEKFIDEFANIYNLNKKRVKILHSMIISLVTFFDDKNSKFTKPFNSTFEKYYKQKKKTDIDKALKLNEEINFIQAYQNEFDVYRPLNTSNINIVDNIQ
ncbi:MAG: hypothetical protein PWQ42_809 [Sulfurospirillum sp.]|jgi:hypothetical protein|nr:hypothetical protein [Sulfurospirillum sp.]